MKRVERSALVGHSAARMYALAIDIPAYPSFLPWCLSSRVISQDAQSTVAQLEVGYKGLRQAFTTTNRNVPDASIEMQLLEGPFKKFEAHWQFTALEANACKVGFVLAYEFATPVLGRVLEPLFDYMADTMVDAFLRQADKTSSHAR